MTAELKIAEAALHHPSISLPSEPIVVEGCDYAKLVETPPTEGPDRLSQLLSSFRTTGFQATTLAMAIEEINRMRSWRAPTIITPDEHGHVQEVPAEGYEEPSRQRCKIFLGYTSNQVSCGNRETIRYLVQNRHVQAIVTTAGGIEEDIIKCLKPTVLGDFKLDGRTLRSQGLNRIGNLLVPSENYCAFEDWLMPVLDRMLDEQVKTGCVWSPRSMIRRLGQEISDERSILYWAWRNDIPIFCPAITDGAIGDMIYFHSYRHEEQLVLDLVQDIRALNSEAMRAGCTGIVCLGGGVVKHHICNANLMRNGADFAVFINTGQEFDGSDSGASPDEAISWGKIRMDARPVKVCCDASIAFPLIVAETFAKEPLEARAELHKTLASTIYL